MTDLSKFSSELSWPVAIAITWLVGELWHRWTKLPRISIYGLVGFVLGHTQLGFLPEINNDSLMFLINIAFGLILFEFGYRINLRWVQANPWLGITGLVEAISTFLVVYSLAQWYDKSTISSLLLASLAMATSPAGILRVINEQQSSGQVTERVLHLTAINCVLAVFTFKIISGFWLFAKSGSLWQAISNSLLMLILSTALGGLFGILVPNIMRRLDSLARDVTVAFAIAIILIVAITQVTNLSPVLASLTFGLMARHMRVAMNKTQRNFGALGELLTIMLFMVVATTLDWQKVVAGFGLACLLVSARWLTKVALVAVFSHYSSISWLKGVLTGMALAPISVFAILMLAQTKYLGKTLITELAPLAAMALLLEIIGPILTHFALVWAKETLISTKRS